MTLRIGPHLAAQYAGESAVVALRGGARVRAWITGCQRDEDTFTIATAEGEDFVIEHLAFDEVEWLEIEGPAEPLAGTSASSPLTVV